MPNLRYICISDLHLGADNSLLTRSGSKPGEVDPSQASEALQVLTSCLRLLIQHNDGAHKPTLILNGDALELALAEDNIALMAFERLLELLFPTHGEPLISPQIIFNPGNHDHHLWETAREAQYATFLQGKRRKKPGRELPAPWHTTNMLEPDLVDSSVLNAVICRHPAMVSQGVSVGIVYPNFCVTNADRSRFVVFSHSHYVESIYMLMTTLGNFVFPKRPAPTHIGTIETENFAWIDFFWSVMGRSGEVGKAIEQMYDVLLVPEARARLTRRLARAAGREWISWAPSVGEWLGLLSAPFLSRVLERVGDLEKRQVDAVLTPEARQGLVAYVEGPVATQLLEESKQPTLAPTTFIFGHTHKPFSERIGFKNFPPGTGVYNSGGWVVDTKHTDPTHGGAIILVDQQLNVVSLRMYNEAENHERYRVRLEAVDSASNPLYAHLAPLVRGDQDPWLSFSRTVARNVDSHHEIFQCRLEMASSFA